MLSPHKGFSAWHPYHHINRSGAWDRGEIASLRKKGQFPHIPFVSLFVVFLGWLIGVEIQTTLLSFLTLKGDNLVSTPEALGLGQG